MLDQPGRFAPQLRTASATAPQTGAHQLCLHQHHHRAGYIGRDREAGRT